MTTTPNVLTLNFDAVLSLGSPLAPVLAGAAAVTVTVLPPEPRPVAPEPRPVAPRPVVPEPRPVAVGLLPPLSPGRLPPLEPVVPPEVEPPEMAKPPSVHPFSNADKKEKKTDTSGRQFQSSVTDIRTTNIAVSISFRIPSCTSGYSTLHATPQPLVHRRGTQAGKLATAILNRMSSW